MIFHVIVALVTWYAKKSTEIVYGIPETEQNTSKL